MAAARQYEMNVSITDVATTMRTLFDCAGIIPDPSDMVKVITAYHQSKSPPEDKLGPGCMLETLVPLLSLVFPHRLILFQHALSGAHGCNNDYRNRADKAGKE